MSSGFDQPRAAVCVAVMLLSVLVVVRWYQPALDRPLEHDELLTLEMYTVAGVNARGAPAAVRRVEDLVSLASLTPIQLLAGLHRSLGVWREPNNHVVHSALVNFAFAAGGRTPRALRVPAFLAAVAFGLVLCWLGFLIGMRAALPFLVALAWTNPYVTTYSVTARGYSLALALSGLLVALLVRSQQAPESAPLRAACCTTALALGITLPTALALWIVPAYAAFLLTPQPRTTAAVSADRFARRCIVDLLFVCAGTGVFFLPHLPYLYSSVGQYGFPRTDLASFGQDLVRLYLTPRAWAIVWVVGLFTPLLVWGGYPPFVRRLTWVVVLVTTMHWLLAARLPYARTIVHGVVLSLLGIAGGFQRLLPGNRSPAGLAIATVAAVAVAVAATLSSGPSYGVTDGRIEAALAIQGSPVGRPSTRILLPPIEDYLLAKYLPRSWRESWEDLRDGETVRFWIWTSHRHGNWGIELRRGSDRTWKPFPCRDACWRVSDTTTLAPAMGTIRNLEPRPYHRPAWIAWVLDPFRVELDGAEILAHLASYNLAYIRRDHFAIVKVERVGVMGALEFLPANAHEYRATLEAVRTGVERFGGQAFQLDAQHPFQARGELDE